MKDQFIRKIFDNLYEEDHLDICENFKHHSVLGTVNHKYFKRKIPFEIDGVTYYDLITPNTYGGPVIEECKEEDKWELVNEFQIAFQHYCIENNIVAEFVHFHPLKMNSMDFIHCYEMNFLEDSHVIEIPKQCNPVTEIFSSNSIERLKNAFKQGLKYEISYGNEKKEDFKRYFLKSWSYISSYKSRHIENCKEVSDNQLVFIETMVDGKVVGMAMCFLSNNILSIKVMVTNEIGDDLDSALVMYFGLMLWSKNKDVEVTHFTSNCINESKEMNKDFKNHFISGLDFKVCNGRKIWNEEIYTKLCNMANVDIYIDYFPAYRLMERGYNFE